MSFQLQRRYSNGFSFQSVYTYAVSKDLPGSTMSVEQPELDWEYAGDDVRHRLETNFILEIPYKPSNQVLYAILGGWQLNGLAILQSGGPFTGEVDVLKGPRLQPDDADPAGVVEHAARSALSGLFSYSRTDNRP